MIVKLQRVDELAACVLAAGQLVAEADIRAAFREQVLALARNLARSTHGRALFAIRDDEIAAEALGVDTTAYKVIAFVIGAFFAGVAGGLFAHYLSYLNPSTFTFLKSIEVIAMVVLGGMGNMPGMEMTTSPRKLDAAPSAPKPPSTVPAKKKDPMADMPGMEGMDHSAHTAPKKP